MVSFAVMGEPKTSATRYVIYGAGSIGCVVGGFLVNSGSRVLFVARRKVAAAIANGYEIKTAESEIRVRGDVVTELDRISIEPDDVVIMTVKSQDTQASVAHLASLYPQSVSIVCLQNSVSNERIVRQKFFRVYGGLLLISTVQLEPEVITVKGNRIAIGCYPDGSDALSEKLAADLSRAGFDAMVSRHVMALKWAKLIANLNNATHAITGYWLEKSAADPEMRALMVAVRQEGLSILDAAGIPVEPPDGEPNPIRIRDDTAKLRQAPGAGQISAWPKERRTYPSMLQDLLLGRKATEADFLNGEIVKLGEKLGIPTPYNRRLMETVQRMTQDQTLKPGMYSPASLRAVIEKAATG
jgi:2-dehydropantoate 2-reductase